MNELEKESSFLFYTSPDGKIKIQIALDGKNETVWTTQKGMSEIFNVEVSAISKHVNNIYDEDELKREGTISKMEIVQQEGKRKVNRNIDFYNLDMIIAVGYRVNSYEATQFRKWATKILKEFLIKGFVLDDERLKQGKRIFNKDYFDELVERIREIRASERRFYQKITDIYAECSIDYDPNSPLTKIFFQTVQNKLEYAITQLTAPEIVSTRADSEKPHMGLTSWKNEARGGKILKSDVSIAKNYLNDKEIRELNIIVNMYLDYAELQATKQQPIKMKDWIEKLNGFLKFNEYEILKDAGKIKSEVAKQIAEQEYEKFRPIQDKEYESDFDKAVKEIKEKQTLPTEKIEDKKNQSLSDFDKNLKGLLSVPPEKDK